MHLEKRKKKWISQKISNFIVFVWNIETGYAQMRKTRAHIKSKSEFQNGGDKTVKQIGSATYFNSLDDFGGGSGGIIITVIQHKTETKLYNFECHSCNGTLYS